LGMGAFTEDYIMKLVANWKRLVRKAWSMRLMALAFALSVTEAVMPFYSDGFPPRFFAILSGLVIAFAWIARIVAQKEFENE
jgi:hypothetical protein